MLIGFDSEKRRPMHAALALIIALPCVVYSPPLLAQADEPGRDSIPAAPPPPNTPKPRDHGQMTLQVAARCQTGYRACPQFPALVRLLRFGAHRASAAKLLGRLGDRRSVGPLAVVAAYDRDPTIARSARAALLRLSLRPKPKLVIARLRKEPDARIRRLAERLVGPADRAFDRAGADEAKRREDSLNTRLFWAHTALPRGEGQVAWTVYNLGLHELEYGINNNFQAGVSLLLPAGMVAVLPHLKFTVPLSPNVHFGFVAEAMMFSLFVADSGDSRIGIFGGGPVLTITSGRWLFNFALPTYGISVPKEDTMAAMIPHLGAGVRVSHRVSLKLEVHTPLALSTIGGLENGKFWLIGYGVRIAGKRLFGDLSFFIPAFVHADDLLEVMPIGVPWLKMGYRW